MAVPASRLLVLAIIFSLSAGFEVAQADRASHLVRGVPDKAERINRGLASMYGLGAERDHVRALMWFILADSEKHYPMLVRFMTPVQLSRAKALAEMCEMSGFSDC